MMSLDYESKIRKIIQEEEDSKDIINESKVKERSIGFNNSNYSDCKSSKEFCPENFKSTNLSPKVDHSKRFNLNLIKSAIRSKHYRQLVKESVIDKCIREHESDIKKILNNERIEESKHLSINSNHLSEKTKNTEKTPDKEINLISQINPKIENSTNAQIKREDSNGFYDKDSSSKKMIRINSLLSVSFIRLIQIV